MTKNEKKNLKETEIEIQKFLSKKKIKGEKI